MGFCPPGPFPFAEPWRLSTPAALLTFTMRFARPADHRPARRRALCGAGHPDLAIREAKRPGAPTRPQRAVLAKHAATRRPVAGSIPPSCRGAVNGVLTQALAVPVTEKATWLAFKALLPAKSTVPPVRLFRPRRGRCPPGLSPLQGSLASTPGIDLSWPPSPLGLDRPPPRPRPRVRPAAPQGVSGEAPGRVSCEIHRPSRGFSPPQRTTVLGSSAVPGYRRRLTRQSEERRPATCPRAPGRPRGSPVRPSLGRCTATWLSPTAARRVGFGPV
jgi:hypothetical protein